MQPGREARPTPPATQPLPRPDEGFLGEVVGERRVPRAEPAQHRPDRRLVATNQRREGVPVVVRDDTGGQLCVGGAQVTPDQPAGVAGLACFRVSAQATT